MSVRSLSRVVVVVAVVAVGVLGTAAPASAHVTISPSTTAAGEHAVLAVAVGHGCAGSSTTELTVQVPERVGAVTPTRHPLWEVSTETVALDPPLVDGHGNRVTERVATVTFRSATPLPDGVRDVVELSVRLPDEVGATLVFPTVQRCEQGESAWIEVPAPGQPADELELPAPALTVTAPEGGDAAAVGAGGGAAGPAVPAVAAAAATGAPAGDGGAGALVGVALGAGLLGALLGGTVLALARRRP